MEQKEIFYKLTFKGIIMKTIKRLITAISIFLVIGAFSGASAGAIFFERSITLEKSNAHVSRSPENSLNHQDIIHP